MPTKHHALPSIAALTLALAACGGEGSSGSAGGGNTAVATPTPTPTATPTPTPTTTGNEEANAIIQAYLRLDLDSLDNYANPVLPAYYDDTVFADDNTPNNDPVTDELAMLGRVLFYDTALSVNDTVSCASCHQQQFGFDDDERFSEGFRGAEFTDAHAMRLGNIRFYAPGDMFWDRRADSVEDQATQPILNPVEMGWSDNGGLAALVAKLQGLEYYPVLFRYVFGDEAITMNRIERALANFERAMISTDSRWDQAYAQVFDPNAQNRNLGVNLPGFTASENRGRQLFMAAPNNGGAGCAGCHRPPTFALAGNSRSNGLDAGETTVFKSPSLKSVGSSTHFMHDGRFDSLLDVIVHYDEGIQAGPALDNRLQAGGAPLRLNLSVSDRQALVDFLLTLDDETLASDPKFSDPFIR
ncbi:cytochrome-c peroxidase [Qipengyuania flava]|uniref:cytochrome-c peroxidase n=1 Tax=Qipengyuania flava TaxID=192812 RepID=UPI001C638897|nr:cytochrome c peroxidase [Qipengyuania flava]QYJ08241.1 hypothetical protein KUV82_05955 [Qipengyuania flava]